MSADCHYAHSDPARPPQSWDPLDRHLERVAALASRLASAFGAEEWGRLAGLWHDVGKYRDDFQDRLHGDPGTVDHAVVGALLAKSKHPELSLPLALAISGHHGGLPNVVAGESGQPTPLLARLRQGADLLDQVTGKLPQAIREPGLPDLPQRLLQESDASRRSAEFWIRFLFSALTDADFLDTEAFFYPGKRAAVARGAASAPALRGRLDEHTHRLAAEAESTAVNAARAEVLAACQESATRRRGAFRLTAPTGAGKTLSAMAFALRHAEHHRLRRVIVVIPYTSIIEQNAARYRQALGDESVIEHHSNLDPLKEAERNRLASENWDAPVIVTTSVQFFESLFASTPSRCRKLHNIARSVIILDEVQTVPSQFLLPIVEALKELVAHYGCTVLLSTATQPALARRDSLPDGLPEVAEIVPDAPALGDRLRRVEVRWPGLAAEPANWPELAAALAKHRQVLAIVHRRQDARDLARLLPEQGTYHLSALMCPCHRLDVLGQVERALARREPCRLVSTQLVEAGVDVDFPVVYRALAGLDSVAQAAGRCNREGRRAPGQVVLFHAPTPPPRGILRKALDTTRCLLAEHNGSVDLSDPATFERFFSSLYFKCDLDARNIQAERCRLNFATVAQRFRLIEDDYSHPVVVPYADVERRLRALREHGPSRTTLRALQPFLVNVYDRDFDALCSAGALEGVADTVYALTPPYHHCYDSTFGLIIGRDTHPSPESLIVSD